MGEGEPFLFEFLIWNDRIQTFFFSIRLEFKLVKKEDRLNKKHILNPKIIIIWENNYSYIYNSYIICTCVRNPETDFDYNEERKKKKKCWKLITWFRISKKKIIKIIDINDWWNEFEKGKKNDFCLEKKIISINLDCFLVLSILQSDFFFRFIVFSSFRFHSTIPFYLAFLFWKNDVATILPSMEVSPQQFTNNVFAIIGSWMLLWCYISLWGSNNKSTSCGLMCV